MSAAHRARKRFGQNFLQDTQVIARIIDALSLQSGDAVVEIGPGQGALTGPLLQRLERLHVIEIDRDLVARLRRSAPAGLKVHEADVLDFNFHALGVSNDLRVVGNLPYYISTELLLRLIRIHPLLRDVTVMLQREVVDRISAPAGTKHYGRLSVLLQNVFDTHHLFDVPPRAFVPVPRVQSAVLHLTPAHHPPPTVVLERLSLLTRLAFASRRKTLNNNLKGHAGMSSLLALQIDPARRGETLDPREFRQWAEHTLQHE